MTLSEKSIKVSDMKTQNNTDNICRFADLPEKRYDEALTMINFVKETDFNNVNAFTAHAVFKLYIICKGRGRITTLQQTCELSRGTVFVTFPATPFYLTDDGGLELMYVSFLGAGAYELLSDRGITSSKCVHRCREDLIAVWEQTISVKNDTALAAEGLLYLTLAGIDASDGKSVGNGANELADAVRRIIDDNYCDRSLSLSFISRKLNYNEKYISTVFKKAFGTNIQNYIANLRMNNALKLINSGITSVKDIAAFSGYGDPLYFSKAFKKMTDASPSEAIKREATLKKGAAGNASRTDADN